MNDFLKKLQESVDSGQINEEITNHHNEILNRADMKDKQEINSVKDGLLYNNELHAYTGDFPAVVSARMENEKYKQEIEKLK